MNSGNWYLVKTNMINFIGKYLSGDDILVFSHCVEIKKEILDMGKVYLNKKQIMEIIEI